ncbi:MAG: methylmalonyl Co-A mutase-associated GTPase MeaB, partial [Chitinophagales bacterium]
ILCRMTGDSITKPDWDQLLAQLKRGDQRSLARCISLLENESTGYEQILEKLGSNESAAVIGITGPPGSGKSSLVDALIGEWIAEGKKVAVICVDPTSPFHFGALLGDRLRMNAWYQHPGVFIRSLASRGAMGGLNPKIIEITDILKTAGFDIIMIETVGVGQNEVDIAGLAETTVLVLTPGAGDDIQAMKSGILEIGDIFVVNKADLPNADDLIRYLRSRNVIDNGAAKDEPIIKTIAIRKEGIGELKALILQHQQEFSTSERKADLEAEKAWRLIIQKKMRRIDRKTLHQRIGEEIKNPGFNLYKFVSAFE